MCTTMLYGTNRQKHKKHVSSFQFPPSNKPSARLLKFMPCAEDRLCNIINRRGTGRIIIVCVQFHRPRPIYDVKTEINRFTISP